MRTIGESCISRRPRLRAVFAALLLIPLLSGCLLISGEQTINGPLAGTGHLSTTFVSAEGGEERTVTVSDANANLHAIVLITLDTGDLQIDVLQPDGRMSAVYYPEGYAAGQMSAKGMIGRA